MHKLDPYLNEIGVVLQRYGIQHASLFGSFSKGAQTDTSDIDLLIEPGINFTLFNLLSLEDELNELTNRKFDLVEFSAIKASIRNEVLNSAVPIL